MNISNQAKELFQTRRYRAVMLAIVVLIALAVIQINHLKVNSPMAELFSGDLNRRDVERIQLAFGNANLNSFDIQDNRILVPQQQRSQYLKAITDQNAIPQHLQSDTPETDSVSIFMSRSQQKSLARQRKKEQIRKMVTRLPFVEQAWFEMDVADSHSAFDAAAQTAVISIEPSEGVILDSAQVDTVTRIIKGAIAGITADQIQVIDIHSGYAHDGNHRTAANQVTQVNGLPAIEQQNYFENRIRRSLTDLAGVEVAVKVDVVENPRQIIQAAQVSLPKAIPPTRSSASLVAGTNGFASIYDGSADAIADEPVEIAPVAYTSPTFSTDVKVDVAVPQALVESRFGSKGNNSGNRTLGFQTTFERLQTEIVNRVSPLLPAGSELARGQSPVSVRLVRSAPVSTLAWQDSFKQLLGKYWPSAAVLAIGVLLISTMNRGGRQRQRLAEETESLNADILSINSTLESRNRQSDQNDENDLRVAEVEEAARREAEQKLNEMVEQNPDTTKRVLESWIKDAA